MVALATNASITLPGSSAGLVMLATSISMGGIALVIPPCAILMSLGNSGVAAGRELHQQGRNRAGDSILTSHSRSAVTETALVIMNIL